MAVTREQNSKKVTIRLIVQIIKIEPAKVEHCRQKKEGPIDVLYPSPAAA